MEPVYLDHAAHGPIRPSVLDAYRDAACRWAVNANNLSHARGRSAAAALDTAREKTSVLIGATPNEITFTSGATESNNWVIFGAALRTNRRRIITVATEHVSVLAPVAALRERHGFDVTLLEVDRWGRLDPQRVIEAVDDQVALVSIMLANNEIGTRHDLAPIGEHCRTLGVPLHTDITQAVGRIPVDVCTLQASFATFSSHKIHGPLGIGALWKHPDETLVPLLLGGRPDQGLRPGTINLPAAVGFGVASEEAADRLNHDPHGLQRTTERLSAGLESIRGALRVSPVEDAVTGIVNVAFPGVDAREVLDATPEIIGATGSACSAHTVTLSPVIEAIDLPRDARLSCIRLSPGWFTTENEIDVALEAMTSTVRTLRERNGLSKARTNREYQA